MTSFKMDWLKRFLSHITTRRVNKGYGISSDDSLTMDHLPSQQAEETARASAYGVKYVLRRDIGRFEYVGMVRKKDGSSAQRLRHILTGEMLDISGPVFKLLFEKE